MRWTERQQALLREMGVRLWWPDGPAGAGGPADASTDAATEAATDAADARSDGGATAVATVATVARGPAGAPLGAPVAIVAPPPAVLAMPAAALSAQPPALLPGVPGSSPSADHAPAEPDALAVPLPPPSAGRASGLRGGRPTIATLDWPALEEAVAGCTACSLCRTRRHTVFGVGHRQAHCMVVGEAPGEQEDRQGEPFVGPAGQLLDRMLAAIGLTRGEAPPERQVFIANTLKCRPPGNRNPTPEELAHCVPFLERQVALVQPRVILAMGRFAVQSLLQTDEAIGRLRGRVHHWQGRALVVTYHPAYLLRQPADKAKAWDDLCLAAELLERGGA